MAMTDAATPIAHKDETRIDTNPELVVGAMIALLVPCFHSTAREVCPFCNRDGAVTGATQSSAHAKLRVSAKIRRFMAHGTIENKM